MLEEKDANIPDKLFERLSPAEVIAVVTNMGTRFNTFSFRELDKMGWFNPVCLELYTLSDDGTWTKRKDSSGFDIGIGQIAERLYDSVGSKTLAELAVDRNTDISSMTAVLTDVHDAGAHALKTDEVP